MKVYLIDIDKRMTDLWEKDFGCKTDVDVINMDFSKFMESHMEVDTIVSAANSFGIMDGGLDATYISFFGEELQKAVQKKIMDEYLGEQVVGSSMIVDIPNYTGKRLIHTPTMRVPQPIIDPRIIYTCTRSALVTAIKNDAKVLVLPAFGHLTGRIKEDIVSKLMLRAYEDVCNRYKDNDFSENTWEKVSTYSNIDDVLIEHFKG